MPVAQKFREAAVRHLDEDGYPHDATGPRRDENRVLDALAPMAPVPDPRGRGSR
ncbi:hypothetical protein [Streptomyces sp. NPDC059814]|uniref:hypothetical protein n=1 Tax=Streptomyces sp. NPDC059814 TaxID=3346959 RepID=UPI0036501A95